MNRCCRRRPLLLFEGRERRNFELRQKPVQAVRQSQQKGQVSVCYLLLLRMQGRLLQN